MLSLLIFNKIILAIPFVCVWTKVSSLMVWHSCSLKLYYGEKNDKVPSTLFIIIYHDEDLPTRYRHSLLRPGGHLGRLLFIFLNRHMRNMLSRFSAKTNLWHQKSQKTLCWKHPSASGPMNFFFPWTREEAWMEWECVWTSLLCWLLRTPLSLSNQNVVWFCFKSQPYAIASN